MKQNLLVSFFRNLAVATGLFALASAASAAAPTVHWNLSLYQHFPQSDWYQVASAQAHDSDGNLIAVRVDYLGEDGAWHAFAWNGGGNGYDNDSDQNYAYKRSDGKAQAFRGIAYDGDWNSSGYIYLLTKPWGSSFTYDDLPIDPDNSHRFFPNAGYRQINSKILGQVLASLNGQNGGTIWFKDGVHEFDSSWNRHQIWVNSANYEWNAVNTYPDETAKVEVVDAGNQIYNYNPGTLGSVTGCANITFKAENTRAAVLTWASYSSTGSLHPSSGDMLTPSNNSGFDKTLYTRSSDPRPWPLPGPFIHVDSSCSNITFEGLEFRTPYDLKTPSSRADNGRHLEIHASHTNVESCGFTRGPGWQLVVAGADYVHLDGNLLYDTSGDGINVSGSHNWIVGNAIFRTGDDAIAINGDDNHAIWNYIENSGWRGVYEAGSTNSNIEYNTINGAAGSGIELDTEGSSSSGMVVENNTLSGIGAWTHHNSGTYVGGRDAIWLGATSGASLANNTINYYGGGSGGGANLSGINIDSRTSDQNLSDVENNNGNTFNYFPSWVPKVTSR